MLYYFLDYVSLIFADLTWFNTFNSLTCFLAVIAIIWAGRIIRGKKEDVSPEKYVSPAANEEDFLKFGYQGSYKLAKQKLIEKNLTQQQRDQEKESVSETLQTVLKLLKERDDIFPSPSLDDLKQQLSLYRPD